MGATLAIVAMAATQACYAYTPIASTASPKVGERARIVLTRDGTTELARYLGPNIAVAEGVVSSVGGDGTLVIAVTFIRSLNGVPQPWTGEGQGSIPREYHAEVQGRTFLRNQSILAGGALLAGLIATAIVALRAGGAKGGEDGGGTPPPP